MKLTIGISQIAPVWLNKAKTLEKIISEIEKAYKKGCELLVFGEGLLPGYPFWVDRTDGARFNSSVQKEIFAHYSTQAVQVERGDLEPISKLAKRFKMAIYLGCIERPADRGGHSLYCSLVYINELGEIGSVHRKLMPTYEERLVWGQGDGNGLVVHPLGPFTLGGLNCWENWMPLTRSALYALGEDLHVSVWPGAQRNTIDLTRFIAMESRSYVISACGLLRREDITDDIPHYDKMLVDCPEILSNGGSCIAGPDGNWVIEPVVDEEVLLVAVIDHMKVREERQNFDPSGHYSRPDVLQLKVNRERQGVSINN